MKKLLFLGGTVGQNNWRVKFISDLQYSGVKRDMIFDPVVKDWNEKAQIAEEIAKKESTHMMFYLGSPMENHNQLSSYSMVEATMSLYDRPEITVVVFDNTDIEGHALKAQKQACKVLKSRFPQANIFASKEEALSWLVKELV